MPSVRKVLENDTRTIESYMYFLARNDLYETEKPYGVRYKPDEDIPQTNIIMDKQNIHAESMRNGAEYRLNECGFQVIDFPSKMSYDDFWNHERIQATYLGEVKAALKRELGAKFIHILDYTVRRRDNTFPISTGQEYEYDQPTSMAHVDFTVREGERMTEILFGDRAGEVLAGHWQIINLWKPIKGPLNDWPLSLCDARTVDWRKDIVPGDVVFDDFVTENIKVYHNPAQKWYYLPDQQISEALIFKSSDSVHSTAPAAIHAGCPNPNSDPQECRESLDCRCLVYFADLPKYPPVIGNVFTPHI